MKTVITDRSLCEYTLGEYADEKNIFSYICALRDAGVRLIEIDARTVIAMKELPDGVKYIFRITDPAAAELADAFDFDYVAIRLNDLKKDIRLTRPTIVELSAEITPYPSLFRLIDSLTRGKLSMIRLRGAFPLMDLAQAAELVRNLRITSSVPMDFLPERAPTALDAAIKLSQAGAESISMCFGSNPRFASFEEYVFTLLSVFDTLPKEFSIAALCKAEVLRKLVFKDCEFDMIKHIIQILDHDISGLVNVDTGERVRMHVSLRDSQFLRREYISALEKMAREQDMPQELLSEFEDAIKHFDVRLHSEEIVKNDKPKVFLN